MSDMLQEKINDLKDYLKKLEYLRSASSTLYWDMRVGIPKKGVPYRAEVLGYLSGEEYKLQTSKAIKEYIDYFSSKKAPDKVTEAMVEKVKKDYERTKKIPEDRYTEYVILTSQAEDKWEEAKEKSDFSIFKPYLEKIVEMNREFIEYWGYEGNKYNTLLDHYEPGITVERLDSIFGELRDAIVKLLNKINSSSHKIETKFLKGVFPRESQEKISEAVLKKMGYDFDAGRIDESMHPFTIELSNRDVRITTHYYEDDLASALFSSIHEGGHAIYEQDIPDELKGTGLASGVSMGIHESQSRFYENILGRSREFWEYFYPELKKVFPQFEDISAYDFYRAINEVKPSLIRIESDELTYSLHIIIRYEIEKMLINNQVRVEELPEVWRGKYREYLGVEPENDAEGVLQDVHWSGGMFGYFPSYALGNLYGAQFLNKMESDIVDFKSHIQNGDLDIVKEWLKEHIHKHGSVYKPNELVKMATGEELSPKYFIEYLNKKYSEIYKL